MTREAMINKKGGTGLTPRGLSLSCRRAVRLVVLPLSGGNQQVVQRAAGMVAAIRGLLPPGTEVRAAFASTCRVCTGD